MEPSGIYWQGLYDRRRSCGYDVCLVSCQAVHNNRKAMQEATSKTDEKDAYSVLDLLRQGKFFLPVARDADAPGGLPLDAPLHGTEKTGQPTPQSIRAAIHLTFPELQSDAQRPDTTSPRYVACRPIPLQRPSCAMAASASWKHGGLAIAVASGVLENCSSSTSWRSTVSAS